MTKKKDRLENRFKLIEKIIKNRKYKPLKKEMKKAYGYLDHCCWCGKELKWIDAFSHGVEGNAHKFGCSKILIALGRIYTLIAIPIKLIIFIICLPFALLIWLGAMLQEKTE